MRHPGWVMALLASAALAQNQSDPPSRVARLNYTGGQVSFAPATLDNWTQATINYPLTTGDRLWADQGSSAEMRLGSTAIRLASQTALEFLNLDDRIAQMRVAQGAVLIRVRYLGEDEVYEVDTPNAAVSLLRPGAYRVDVDPNGNTTTVTVRAGEAEITAGAAYPVRSRESAYVSGNPPSVQVQAAGPPDGFDNWSEQRDAREDSRPAPRYVSREMIGYEDLDDNGAWETYPDYGAVWVPRVAAGWAPYTVGRWGWVEPWGWTWIDAEPWGFAPFHYGRWAFLRNRWGWVPGPMVARPVYAPALVAFIGGRNWGVSLSFGGGGGVGWFPLGPREPYIPGYHGSPAYVNRVNVVNVTNINVTNVTNINYVNRNVPGAVVAVSRNDFVSARPVRQAAVRVPVNDVRSAPVVGTAPVAPQPASVLVRATPANAARPPQAALARPVVARRPPPPPPVPFAAKQSQLAANPGRPLTPAQVAAIRPAAPAAPRPAVRVVTPEVAARPGQPVTARPAPTAPAPAIRPPQPPPASAGVPAARPVQPPRFPAPAPQARPAQPNRPVRPQEVPQRTPEYQQRPTQPPQQQRPQERPEPQPTYRPQPVPPRQPEFQQPRPAERPRQAPEQRPPAYQPPPRTETPRQPEYQRPQPSPQRQPEYQQRPPAQRPQERPPQSASRPAPPPSRPQPAPARQQEKKKE